MFGYRVRIENRARETVQLLTRHWQITDGRGRVVEVRGEGVVGEQPLLEPGESFQYTSGTPLPTPTGHHGRQLPDGDRRGERFDVDDPGLLARRAGRARAGELTRPPSARLAVAIVLEPRGRLPVDPATRPAPLPEHRPPPLTILLAGPRGFCAGVERAIEIVKEALRQNGRAGLCPPRDRPQPPRGRRAARRWARCSSRSWTRCPRTGWSCSRPTACPRRCRPRRAGAGCCSPTPPARWSPRSIARSSATTRPGRTVLLIGHAGHPEVIGTMGQVAPGSVLLVETRGRRRGRGRARPGAARLLDPDHALGGRHRRHRRGAAAALPRDRGAAQRGHLLRHHQPPARRGGDRPARRPVPGRGCRQLVQLDAAGRGRAPATAAPQRRADRDRRRHRLGLARRRRARWASPPAPPPRSCWSRRWSPPAASAFAVTVEEVRVAEENVTFRSPPIPLARQGLLSAVAVYTDVPPDALRALPGRLRAGRAGRARRHRRGRGELQLPPRRPSAAASS